MMHFPAPKENDRGFAVSSLSTSVRRSTGSNYNDHSSKEQGKQEFFVRFSEQPPDFTTVYR
jgi:hypothetical protein